MKTSAAFLITCAIMMGNPVGAQYNGLPETDLYDLDGARINASELSGEDATLIMIFWNSNDKKSFEQLLDVSEQYQELLKAENIKVLGICTDVNGNIQQVKPVVLANNIDFEVYVDKNNDFKRAMNVSGSPYLILVAGNQAHEHRYAGNSFNIEDYFGQDQDSHLAVNPDGQ